MKTFGRLAPVLLLFPLAACDSPGPSDLDPSIRSLLSGPMLVGEVESFVGASAAGIPLDGGVEGADYVLIVSNVSKAGGASVEVSVQGDGITPAPATADAVGHAPDLHSDVRGGFGVGIADGGPGSSGGGSPLGLLDDGGFHHWHLERETRLAREMVGHLPHGGRSLLLEASPAIQVVPSVDDVIQINVNAADACANPDWRDARVEAVSDQAIVLADLENPEGLTRDDFERIASDFDQKVYPLAAANFGEPAREIGPARTTILYTVAVNELASDFGGLVGGFFFSRDLFPQVAGGGLQGCSASNEREMFYLLTADPDGVHGDPIPLDFIRDRTLNTVVHEHQHLINASRRLYVHGAGSLEAVWLNEGLSHIAEELLFYQESGLSPGRNLDLDDVRASQQRLDAVNFYQVQNLVRYMLYLADTPDNTPINPSDGLETRGASWSFLRYLADQHAEDDSNFFQSLVNTTDVGIDNLENRLGLDLGAPLWQWDASNYADDLVPGLSPVYRQPSWDFRSLLPALAQDETFPLTGEPLVAGEGLSLSVRGGSAAFFRLSVPSGERGTIATLSGGTTPPATVRVTVIRTR